MNVSQKASVILRMIVPGLLLAALLTACGDSKDDDKQTTGENLVIGIVNLSDALAPVIEGFKADMAEQGYTEGENITYVYDGPVNNVTDLDAAVQKLVDAKVNLIFSLSTPATLAAKRVTANANTPVVFGTVTDPIATGVVDNLARPGANITGIKTGGSEQKELEWLKTIVPATQAVYILHNPDDASSSKALNDVRETAEALGIDIVAVETPSRDAVLAALDDMPDTIDGILMLPDSIVVAQIGDIVAFALERKLPLAGINKEHVEAGALLAFGPEHFESGRQAARLARQVLNGITPAELPVETAQFYLLVNLQTASAIGVTIDDTILQAAQTILR